MSSATHSAPCYRFGSSPSRGKNRITSHAGPGSYKAPSAMGDQALSSKFSSPASKFGTSSRSGLTIGKPNPTGPGEYALSSTIGRQEVSTMCVLYDVSSLCSLSSLLLHSKSLPAYSFGASTRDARSKLEAKADTMLGQVGAAFLINILAEVLLCRCPLLGNRQTGN